MGEAEKAMPRVQLAMADYWGQKCCEFDQDCECCLAWKELDDLRTAAALAKQAVERVEGELVDQAFHNNEAARGYLAEIRQRNCKLSALEAERAKLVEERDELLCHVHQCPDCKEYCKGCRCYEERSAKQAAEIARLREKS